jgi:hypothetical protein
MASPPGLVLSAAAMSIVAVLPITSGAGETERRMLADLQPFTVEVDELPASMVGSDLDLEGLRSMGEARLRAAGMPLADRATRPRAPYLLIRLEGECRPTGACVSFLQLYLGWLLDTTRDPEGVRLVRVWLDQTQVYGNMAGYQGAASLALYRVLDAFVSEYRLAQAGR